MTGGPYRAEFGAIHHRDERHFLFTVTPATAADEVARALNLVAAEEDPKKAELTADFAPSSLAGGEAMKSLRFIANMERKTDRLGSVMVANWIIQDLAALSPEAPAREGVVMAAADAPVWADGIVTDGENVAMAQKAEADHGGHYWAVDEGNGGLDWEPTHFISLDALTPRHEAPAMGAIRAASERDINR